MLGCFSDPGIEVIREATDKPVTGIAESAYLAALGLGHRFGIVSLGPSSIARHLRYLEKLKLAGRLAGDRLHRHDHSATHVQQRSRDRRANRQIAA